EVARQAPGLRADPLYQWGNVLWNRGEPRGALDAFERAKVAALRVGNAPTLAAAQQGELEVLRHLGRFDTHLARIRELEASVPSLDRPCDRSERLHNIGVFRSELEEHENRGPSPETLASLEEAYALTETACPNPGYRAHHAASLARALTAAHRPAEALALA